jgi:5-methylcytosine-specific restriction endonuclease McrA
VAKKQKLGKRWKDVRKLAVDRDKQCLKCGIPKPLSVHHVLPKSLYPEKTFDLNNLKTLCCNCHAQLHQQISLANMCPSKNDRANFPGSAYFDKWLKSG